MKFKSVLFLAPIISLAIGCAKESPKSKSDPGSTPKTVEPVDNNYFMQFVSDIDNCMTGQTRFKLASSAYGTSLNANAYYRIKANLYLFPDGNYLVQLNKLAPSVRPDSYQVIESYFRDGKWLVVNGELKLKNLGIGRKSTVNGIPALEVKIEDNYPDKVFDGSTVILILSIDNCQ